MRMYKHSHHLLFKKSCSALTLIELLVSISIATLIVAILLPLLALFINAISKNSLEETLYFEASTAFETIQKDLMCAVVPQTLSGTVFSLKSANTSLYISFFSALPLDKSDNHKDYEIRQIQYSWNNKTDDISIDKENYPTFIRSSTPFRVAGKMENTSWRNISKAEMKVFINGNWTNFCELSTKDILPSRANLILHFADNTLPAITSEFLIPSGFYITRTNPVSNKTLTNNSKI